jgi:ABC-type transport system involved in multi-copper enzyme maturation permease subunit
MTTPAIAFEELPPAPKPALTARTVGFGNVMRSEWTKMRSLRSSYACLGLVVLSVIGIAVLMGIRWHQVLAGNAAKADGFDATNVTLSGVYIAQVVLGAVGVLAISSEYGTGMIRATFAAVPQRRAVLAAKALVLTISTLIISEIVCFTGFGIGQALLGRDGFGVSLSDPGVFRAVSGAGLYLTAVALLGFGLGACIRHTAGALSAFFGVLFALTVIVDLLPTNLRNDIINYMPANSGSQIFTVVPVHGALSPWAGLGVFCLYVVASLVTGFVLVGLRDA